MKYQVTIPQWLSLHPETRQRLKEAFGVQRTGQPTFQQVGSIGTVTSDGHTHPDLEVITLERMNEFLGEEHKDFYPAFERVVERIEKRGEAEYVVVTSKTLTGKNPLCESCDTRGTRHKRDCPKAKK